MKNSFIKVISLMLAALIFTGTALINAGAENGKTSVEIISFGSYPQTEVTDEKLISALNGLNPVWKSCGYYSGTGIYDDGRMSPSDYMRYADAEYENEKYRAVTFDTFRPTFTGYETSAVADTYQDSNGYACNRVYWFRYEPLEWRVLDREKGYVICESIIDSQPFSNYLYFNGSAFYMDDKGWDYSNYYVNSSLRSWLNVEFADTAFTDEEKDKITANHMDDSQKDIYDKVFIPSADEVKNTSYWKDDASKTASGTDYAECQGLFVTEGKSYWRLRSLSDWSQYACSVCTDGTVYGYNYYYCCYPYATSFTGTGIRPAIKLADLSDKSLNPSERVIENNPSEEKKMSFSEKAGAFFSGISSVAKYYLAPSVKADEKTAYVMNSLQRGINVPCMESGWAREWVLEKETYDNIVGKGFDYIRLPANLCCMLDENGIFNESAACCLDRALEYALESGLSVILDLHGWETLNEDPSAENIETLVSVWKQTAERYKDCPTALMFEILNEPNNSSEEMSSAKWNYIQNKVTAAIREIDSNRIIILSTENWNSPSSLSKLVYNHRDPDIIIDVHNYAPMDFTHQGAEWVDGLEEKVPFTPEAAEAFAADIKKAGDFSKKYGTKIIVGEFGVYLRQTNEEDVNAFLTAAVKCMKDNNLPWAYWEYYAGFGAYSCETKQWKNFVTDALLG